MIVMSGIYEMRHCDGLSWYDIHTNFYKDWFSHLEDVRGDTHTDHTHRQQGEFISLRLFFFQNIRKLY
jgi:hypothetical protein